MCDYSKGIRLCSCNASEIRFRDPDSYRQSYRGNTLVTNKRNERIPLIPIWRLYRHNGPSESNEIGRYLTPDTSLGNGLQQEEIVGQLNARNCFDFDYSPVDGDNLHIQYNIRGATPYLSFIFRNGQWEISHYSPFAHHTSHLVDGLLESTD